jgi:hypothetical protein
LKIRIAIAQLYGNKVNYFLENGEFYRINAYSKDNLLPFTNKNQMFKELNNAEQLNILDAKLKEVILNNTFFSF